MLELLQRLFIGHVHKYEIIKEVSLYKDHNTENNLPTATQYHLQCTICGNVKFKKS